MVTLGFFMILILAIVFIKQTTKCNWFETVLLSCLVAAVWPVFIFAIPALLGLLAIFVVIMYLVGSYYNRGWLTFPTFIIRIWDGVVHK